MRVRIAGFKRKREGGRDREGERKREREKYKERGGGTLCRVQEMGRKGERKRERERESVCVLSVCLVCVCVCVCVKEREDPMNTFGVDFGARSDQIAHHRQPPAFVIDVYLVYFNTSVEYFFFCCIFAMMRSRRAPRAFGRTDHNFVYSDFDTDPSTLS